MIERTADRYKGGGVQKVSASKKIIAQPRIRKTVSRIWSLGKLECAGRGRKPNVDESWTKLWMINNYHNTSQLSPVRTSNGTQNFVFTSFLFYCCEIWWNKMPEKSKDILFVSLVYFNCDLKCLFSILLEFFAHRLNGDCRIQQCLQIITRHCPGKNKLFGQGP